ncbi:MAG: type II secretion system F family protein [[Eubacterium] siraeum]
MLQDGEDKNKAALLEKILRSIENGSSITRAFDKTEVFPNYFIKMLEVGESTRLDTVLASLADYYAGIDEISTSVKVRLHTLRYCL